MTTLTAIDSEGARSARRIWDEVPEAPGSMAGDPYLLRTPRTDSALAQANARKPRPPLRLIRLADTAPVCGIGTCAVSPECTRDCKYREADRALRGHYNDRHTQRQAMPGEQPATTGHSDENGPVQYVRTLHEVLILGGLALVLLAALALPVGAYLLTR